ncbi:uncharacterized protein LOC125853670 isoform X1 [Solanum stenotomum]|uniref:uncharacterized protein LOC125853670 isoform X1 n=1 Tax=Solanum stenotomum TaxID=172797 RepID=UPI0020D0F0F7|nr:uncharacterized protein LOC125853670 isoform X1 [Solanum stenotomum]
MATGPNRASPPVYEDFRPVSERHQEAGAEKLLISLPGFMKESIRVSTEGKNTVRVGGELFIGSNTWRRFQEDFQAPDDCNMKRINVKFEDGMLTITMPRKMPRQLLDEQAKQFPHRIPQKDDHIPPRNNHSTDETPRKPTPLKRTAQHADKDEDSTRNETLGSAESSKTQKGNNVPPRTTYPTTEAAPRKPTPLKPTAQLPKPQHAHKDQNFTRNETSGSAESSKTQKGDNVPPRTTYPTTEAAPRKPTPLKPTAQLPKPQNADKDQDSGVKENKFSDDQLMSTESSKTQKGDKNIDFPALRTIPLGKTSGEKEKSKDEKKILEGLVGSIEPKGDNVPPRTTYPTTEDAPRKPTPSKPTAQLPKPQNADKYQDSGVKENKLFDDQLMNVESSKTQKGDEDIDFPSLRTTPLGKTSGEREKTKDEKKILEGLVGSIEPKIQKSKEENLDQNRTQLIRSGKDVEKKESHDAGGKIVAEKIKDLREEFQEKVGQKGSKEKESTSNVAAGTSFYPGSIGNLKKSLVELNEERQLLVNAGAAVMVIMALGVYVYYSIGSGRTE